MKQTPILLVSTFNEVCGIAEYAAYWKDAVEQADPVLKVEVETILNPSAPLKFVSLPKVVVLNYQAALLSQWHPEHIREVQARGSKVLTIWHDSGVPNSDHCKEICAASDYFVLHEPFDDLPSNGAYIRQGVPDWQDPFWRFQTLRNQMVRDGLWWGEQPVVGSVGLSLGYRNLDVLCQAAAIAGWGTLLLTPKATEDDEFRWKELNPATAVIRDFIARGDVVSYLAGCDATAFLLVTNNAGTSGSVRQGLAARKPLLALKTRQLRDLENDKMIRWQDDGSPLGIAVALSRLPAGQDRGIVYLAERDSWRNAGEQYAAILRGLL